jgi:predicted CXXCH cytochrome family protein
VPHAEKLETIDFVEQHQVKTSLKLGSLFTSGPSWIAVFVLFSLGLLCSNGLLGVPVAAGQSVATRTPTMTKTRDAFAPTPTYTRTPLRSATPTLAATLTATPSATATPPAVPSATLTPTDTPTDTSTATETATGAPTEIPTATSSPTLTTTVDTTATATATETGAPTATDIATLSETPTATFTASVAPTTSDTPTPTPTAASSQTDTPTATATATNTPTATVTRTTTLTPTPAITNTVQLSVSPREAFVAPGGLTTYTVTLTNPNTITNSITLITTDTITQSFTSSLQTTRFVLAPSAVATTTLAVSISSAAQRSVANDTTVSATIEGVECAHATVTTHVLFVQFNRALSGLGVSDHAVSPDTQVQMQVGIGATAPLTSTVLTDYLPRPWQVLDTGGGTLTVVDSDTQKIEWTLRNLAAGAVLTKTFTLASPPASNPPPEYFFQTGLVSGGQRFFGAPWSVRLEHPLALDHYRVGWDAPLRSMSYVAPTDTTGPGIPRFKAFRVRFQVFNDQLSAVRWRPRLEWSDRADGNFQPLVTREPQVGAPFYVRPVEDVANGERIRTFHFGTGWDTHSPQDGYAFTEVNPAPVLTLYAYSFTEIEFSVRATVDAEYLRDYVFRLTDDGLLLRGPLAQIVTGAQPLLKLTEPQYRGIAPNAPKPSARPRALGSAGNLLAPHGPYNLTTGDCANCHRDHTASNNNLLPQPPAQSNLCFTCHDGSNAASNIKSEYADPNVLPNDPATSSLYSHPATTPSSHTSAETDEFHNVLNRHSECSDCHDSHRVDNSLAAPSANGYTVSGALKNISGVGAGGSTRTLAWDSSITYEYELCYKCHSSYTVLRTYAKPSYQMTDVAAEFNPANPSFHPIEGVGTNTTLTMTNSLTGTSPYKLWTFQTGDVVRCVNCHGDYRLANPAAPPAANALLAPHTSANRGMLMNNYRDRLLKPSGEPYQASDFALCYQCHAEAPYVDTSGDPRGDTGFRYHGYHLNNISDQGSAGTDIDTPGAGQGNALCAECHYRTHGQGTNASGNPSGTRLLNFAPDVKSNAKGILNWDPTARTCALSCHGYDHDGATY